MAAACCTTAPAGARTGESAIPGNGSSTRGAVEGVDVSRPAVDVARSRRPAEALLAGSCSDVSDVGLLTTGAGGVRMETARRRLPGLADGSSSPTPRSAGLRLPSALGDAP